MRHCSTGDSRDQKRSEDREIGSMNIIVTVVWAADLYNV